LFSTVAVCGEVLWVAPIIYLWRFSYESKEEIVVVPGAGGRVRGAVWRMRSDNGIVWGRRRKRGGGDEEDPGSALSFYVSGNDEGSDANDGLSEDTPFKTLLAAYEAARDSTDRKHIVVLSDLSDAGAVVFDPDGGSTELITIKGEGGEHTITRSTGTNGSVLEITNGAKIEFLDIKVDGISGNTDKEPVGYNRAIKVDGVGSAVTLGKGAVITGKLEGTASGDGFTTGDKTLQGSGVSVTYSGTLTITGGEVTGCLGTKSLGAVFARYGGSVQMDGGSIHHNTTYRGGGVAMYQDSKFEMTGGEIYKNTANGKAGGGIYVMGNSDSPPTLTLAGGKIFNNEAMEGAGVYVASQLFSFTIGDGVEISKNTATGSGGGIYAKDSGENSGESTITMTGGTISENTATNDGGGVYMESAFNNVSFTMTGGKISGNTAGKDNLSGGNGGGVYVIKSQNGGDKVATFTLKGGVVYGSDDGEKANKAISGKAIYGKAEQYYSVTVKIGTTGDDPLTASQAWDDTVGQN
jgi:predicted outer membrane repeat protein